MARAVALVAAAVWVCAATAAAAQGLTGAQAAAEWLAVLPLLAITGAAAWWFRRQRRRAMRRYGRLRARQSRLMSTALRLNDASGLLRLFHGGRTQPGDLTRRFREVLDEANGATALLEAIERDLRRWRVGHATAALPAAEAHMARLDHEIAGLQACLRELNDSNHECARCQTEARALVEEVREAAGARSVGYAVDVLEVLDALAEELDAVEVLRAAGDPLQALQRCRAVLASIQAQRRILEGREATLQWLRGVPAELARLESEHRRLVAEGYLRLPHVPRAVLQATAQQAVEQLLRGELLAAAEAQRELRGKLTTLRQRLTGLEESRLNNARLLRNLSAELRALESHSATLPEPGVRERFPRSSWASAERLQAEVDAEAWSVHTRLQAATRANAMDAQRFEEAHAILREAESLLRRMREELERCDAQWRSLPREEARLKERLTELEEQAAEALRDGSRLGLGRDQTIHALLVEGRQALNDRPLTLDRAETTLNAAQAALGAFRSRLDALRERLSSQAGTVIFHREEPSARPALWRRGGPR